MPAQEKFGAWIVPGVKWCGSDAEDLGGTWKNVPMKEITFANTVVQTFEIYEGTITTMTLITILYWHPVEGSFETKGH